MDNHLETATFGAGCFWCVETLFQRLDGVVSVVSGYSGGARENTSYEQVCSGASGHAEVIQVVYDPLKISFADLLQVFWSVHDPTTLNRQGADVGSQYRSVVFYHDEMQKAEALRFKAELNENKVFSNPVVTEVAPFTRFFPAEKYHQDYYNNNHSQPYCTFVIEPKLEKFKKVFDKKLKK